MKKFWMVWNEGNREPRYKHSNELDARTEAERIARLNPGSTIYILESIDSCRLADIVWSNPINDDMTPF